MKSRLILAALNYAIEQAENSDINILDFDYSKQTEEEAQPTVEDQIAKLIETRDLLQSKATAKLALLMIDFMINKNADHNVAPNLIQERAYDVLIEDGFDADYCEKIADNMFELSSDLVSAIDAQYE